MEAFHKKTESDSYNRFFKYKKVDACKVLADLDSHYFIKDRVEHFNKTLNGIVHKCPYKKFDTDRYTLSFGKIIGNSNMTAYLPNGHVKALIRLYNRKGHIGYFE